MNDYGSPNDTCFPTQLDQMIFNPNKSNPLLTDGNVSKITDMSIL